MKKPILYITLIMMLTIFLGAMLKHKMNETKVESIQEPEVQGIVD